MSRRSTTRRICAQLLAMAAATSARSLTLSDFELITSNAIPLHCITAYNLPLLGCNKSDFAKDRSCSTSCLISVRAVEAGIQIACYNVNPDPSTLVGQAVAGKLAEILCPGETSTTTSTRVVTRTVGSFTAIPTPTTPRTTPATSRDITSTAPTLATTTSENQESETQTTTESPTPETQPTETLETTETSTDAPTTLVVTTTLTPPQTTSAQQTARPTQPTQQDDSNESPGGSPFDPVIANLGSRQGVSRWLEASLLVTTLLFLLLR